LKRRQLEIDSTKEAEQQKARATVELQAIVHDVVFNWANYLGLPRSFEQMLNLLPQVTQLIPQGIFGDVVFTDASPSSEVIRQSSDIIAIILQSTG